MPKNLQGEYFSQHSVNAKPPFNFAVQSRPQSPPSMPMSNNMYISSPYTTPQFYPSSPIKQSIDNTNTNTNTNTNANASKMVGNPMY